MFVYIMQFITATVAPFSTITTGGVRAYEYECEYSSGSHIATICISTLGKYAPFIVMLG